MGFYVPTDLLPLIGRDHELSQLWMQFTSHAKERLSGLIVFGPAGVGKTALALTFAQRCGSLFPGGVWTDHIPAVPEAWRDHEFAEAADSVLGPLARTIDREQRTLVILDDDIEDDEYLVTAVSEIILDRLAQFSPAPGVLVLKRTVHAVARRSWRTEAFELAERTSPAPLPGSGPIDTDSAFTSGVALDVLPLSPVYRSDIRRAILDKAGGSTRSVRQLVRRTRGDLTTAALLLQLMEAGEPSEMVVARFEPVEYVGLTDIRGRPVDEPSAEVLEYGSEQALVVRSALLKRIASQPELMSRLTPRQFEELVAELYERAGFDVQLTPSTRDGGFDVFAHQDTPFGGIVTLIECKRFAQHRRVDVRLVRHLFGVVEDSGANAGVIATTSTFTRDAKAFAKRHNRLALQDYFSLQDMLSSHGST